MTSNPQRVRRTMIGIWYRLQPPVLAACLLLAGICCAPGDGRAAALPVGVHGFFEAAAGLRLGDDRTRKEGTNLLEGRLQLTCSLYPEQPAVLAGWNTEFFFKGDLLADLHAEEPDGAVRECYVQASPLSFLDIKLGRQILTWGTGDLIFINDLFPKDFVSLFIGRDVEYLKMPSDALKLSLYTRAVNLDLVCIPFFRPDQQIRGDRLSFFSPFARSLEGSDADLHYNRRGNAPDNAELALRLHRMLQSYEVALYGFWGYYKQPAGVKNIRRREVFYPGLMVLGGSIRGPALAGIASFEFGYYHSREDTSGHDPLVENSSLRYLVGYEYQFPDDMLISLQYYVSQMRDYHDYRVTQPSGMPAQDAWLQWITMRATKFLFHQDLELSLFIYYSPSADDFHLRPRVTWELTDRWKLILGANIFGGEDIYSSFGQLRRNDTAYMRIRYSF
ncbi:hypothetical protein ACFL43_04855 [Thermodesulfobacteriota bacterium]